MAIFAPPSLAGQLSALTVPNPLGSKAARDEFAPNYELKIRGGKGASPVSLTDKIKQYITSIEFEDNADQFDRLTITFENQVDQFGGGSILSLIDNKLFAEGSIIEVLMGWGNNLRTIGAAEIVKKSPDFPADGNPSFTLEGYDLLHKASRSKPRGGVSYKDVRDSQIASIIGSRNGFDISATDPDSFRTIRRTSGAVDRVQNKGTSDYEFLKKVAQINGFDLFSKFDTEKKRFVLHFKPSGLKNNREVFTFTYNAGEISYKDSLISFSPTLDAHDQGTDFEVYLVQNKESSTTKYKPYTQSTLDSQKEILENNQRRFTGGNAGSQDGKQFPVDDSIEVAFKAYGRSFRFLPHKRFKNEDQARNAITQFIKRQKENFITASGSLLGNEAVQSRQIHNLQGISEQFSGKYYFNQVIHKMNLDEGYNIDFSCRKVIEDVAIQTIPGLALTENDETLEKIKELI